MNLTKPDNIAEDWKAYPPDNKGDFGDGTFWEIEDCTGHVATVYGEGQEAKDHATQIAAIPSLLGALEQLAAIELADGNFDSWEAANRHIRDIAQAVLIEAGYAKPPGPSLEETYPALSLEIIADDVTTSRKESDRICAALRQWWHRSEFIQRSFSTGIDIRDVAKLWLSYLHDKSEGVPFDPP